MNSLRIPWVLILLALLSTPVSAVVNDSEGEERSPNAALNYWLAFQFMPNVLDEKIWNATTDDKKFGFGVPVSEQLAKVFQSGGGEQSLKHLHRGAALSYCEWGTDLRKDGLYASAEPYANKARHLARLSHARIAGPV
jgi:hypothetical protein